MKLIPAFTLSIIAFSLLQLLMCSNTSDANKRNASISVEERTDTSLRAFQNFVDSATKFIYEYDSLKYILGKNKKTSDSINAAQKEVTQQLIQAENYNLAVICTGDTSKKAVSRTKEQLKEIHLKIFLLQQNKDKLTVETARLAQEKTGTESQLSAREEDWQKLSKKLAVFTSRINGPVQLVFMGKKYKLFIADTKTNDLYIHNNPKGAYTFTKFKETVQKNLQTGPLMITNGGMFTGSHAPQGLLICNSKMLAPIDSIFEKKEGNFYLYPNGVLVMDSIKGYQVLETREYIKEYIVNKKIPAYATQSGPMLVYDGRVHERFTPGSANQNIRNGAGIIAKDRVIFAISEQPVNFYEMALLYRYVFSCSDALYLDGAISKMYLEGDKKMPDGEFGPMIAILKKMKK